MPKDDYRILAEDGRLFCRGIYKDGDYTLEGAKGLTIKLSSLHAQIYDPNLNRGRKGKGSKKEEHER